MARLIDYSLKDFLEAYGQLDADVKVMLWHLNLANVPACYVWDAYNRESVSRPKSKAEIDSLERDRGIVKLIGTQLKHLNVDHEQLNALLAEYNMAEDDKSRQVAWDNLFGFMLELYSANGALVSQIPTTYNGNFLEFEENLRRIACLNCEVLEKEIAEKIAHCLRVNYSGYVSSGMKTIEEYEKLSNPSCDEESKAIQKIIESAMTVDAEFREFSRGYPTDIDEWREKYNSAPELGNRLVALLRLADIANYLDENCQSWDYLLKSDFAIIASRAIDLIREKQRISSRYSLNIKTAIERYQKDSSDSSSLFICFSSVCQLARQLDASFEDYMFAIDVVSALEEHYIKKGGIPLELKPVIASYRSSSSFEERVVSLGNLCREAEKFGFFLANGIMERAVEIIQEFEPVTKQIPSDIDETIKNYQSKTIFSEKALYLGVLLEVAKSIDSSFDFSLITSRANSILAIIESSDSLLTQAINKIIETALDDKERFSDVIISFARLGLYFSGERDCPFNDMYFWPEMFNPAYPSPIIPCDNRAVVGYDPSVKVLERVMRNSD